MAIDSAPAARRGLGELLRDLAEGSSELVRGELRLARIELGAAAHGASIGTAYVAVGGVLMLLGALAAFTGLILLVGDQWLPRDLYWLAALIVALIAGAVALWFVLRGRAALSPSTLVRETVSTLKEDKEWLKQQKM